VEELGGTVTKDYGLLTHLVMREAERTEKLLCALSTAKYIVNEKWITDSAAQQKFLGKTVRLAKISILTMGFTDPEHYVFTDSNLEQHYNFSFKDLLKKPNRSELFKVR
jgi:Regulator of Ty1 transposition protein 107 BRCT domain